MKDLKKNFRKKIILLGKMIKITLKLEKEEKKVFNLNFNKKEIQK